MTQILLSCHCYFQHQQQSARARRTATIMGHRTKKNLFKDNARVPHLFRVVAFLALLMG
jgi:hypothetical protein